MTTKQHQQTKKDVQKYLYVFTESYSEESHSHVADDPGEDDGPYSGYRQVHRNVTVVGVGKTKDSFKSTGYNSDYESVLVDDATFNSEKVWLVCVTYSDGDTFSNTSGLLNIPHICSQPEHAKIIADSIRRGTYMADLDMYLPWTGYFTSLENVEVLEKSVSL